MNELAKEFSALLNPSNMLALFQRELPAHITHECLLTGCEIQHPRFKTFLNPASRDKSSLALAYHLSSTKTHTGQTERKILYVKAFLAARSFEIYQKARIDEDNGGNEHVIHLPELDLVAWLFPYDPVLTWLPKLLEPGHIKSYLSHLLFAKTDGTETIVIQVVTTVVNYRPEIRCTCRHDVVWLTSQPDTVFSKTYADQLGLEVFRRMSLFHHRSLQKESAFAVAKPMSYEEIYRTLWMEGLKGTPLLEVMTEENADNLMARLAYALAEFHTANIDGMTAITEDDLFGEIEKKLTKLANAYPIWQGRFQSLLQQLSVEKAELPLSPACLIHGDFHIHQLLLLQNERIALFDFDELALGSPLLDVANFCADLYTQPISNELMAKMVNNFFNAYLKFSVLDLNVKQFNWHLRIQLLTRAYRAYIQQKPEREKWIENFIAAAERGFNPK